MISEKKFGKLLQKKSVYDIIFGSGSNRDGTVRCGLCMNVPIS